MSATDPLGGGGGGNGGDGLSTPENSIDLEIKPAEVKKDESEDRMASSLVYSTEPADRQRGIAILEDSLTHSGGVFQQQQMLYLLAVGYHRGEDYPTSMHYLDRCLEIAPDWEAALSLKKMVEEQYVRSTYLIAFRYHQSGDYETSMSNLDLCLEIAPNCEDALSLKTTIEEQRARARAQSLYEVAVEYYKRRDYPTSLRNLDLCLEIEPNCEEALSLLKNTIEKQNAQYLYLLAVEDYERGDYPASMQYLDRCLEIDPDCEEALSLIKTIASKIENNDGGAQSLKKTIEEKYARISKIYRALQTVGLESASLLVGQQR